MTTTYLVSPETMHGMLNDCFLELREVCDEEAAMELIEHLDRSLISDSDMLIAYDRSTISDILVGFSSAVRGRLHGSTLYGDVIDIVVECLTDEFYLTA